jgi:calcium-translocating P-type ATPase
LHGGAEFVDMIMVAIALAVAAVPETLALIVTLTLTNGVQKMVKKNALIRKLVAVETLGSASVICSDKTGTLTQNRMTVKQLWMRGGEPFSADAEFTKEQVCFLERFSMAGNAVVETDENGNKTFIGSATEVGILILLDEKGYCEIAKKDYPRVAEIPFSSDRKKVTAILKDEIEGGYIVMTAGALDRLPLCPESIATDMETAQRVHEDFARNALRCIALAGKRIDTIPDNEHLEELEQDIKLLGLVGLIDPPRMEAAAAIQEAHRAGIHTVMITGDHATTAEAIAKELSIIEEGKHVMTGARLAQMCDVELHDTVRNYTVYARVSPEDKIRIVKAWQANGETVAMTGDGVNDAPALKAADIGVAMGKAGTEVAKSASDMILTDDNYTTIVDAISEGRNVYRIVKMVIYFLLVCNFSEILIMLFGQMAGWGMALTPVMLLLINILGDGIPGISLAKEVSDADLMNNKPIKKDESLFGDGLLRLILRQTIFCTVVTLIGFYIGAFMDVCDTVAPSEKVGQTMAFLICGWTSIIHIFSVRTSKSVFKTSIMNNKSLTFSAIAMILIFGLMAALPFGDIFGLTSIGGFRWLVVIGLSMVPLLMRELFRIMDNIYFVQGHRKLARESKKIIKKHRKQMKEEYRQMRKELVKKNK